MHHWSFIYQYAIGGTFLLVSIGLLVRSRAIDLATREGRRALAVLAGVLLVLAGLHALSVFLFPYL